MILKTIDRIIIISRRKKMVWRRVFLGALVIVVMIIQCDDNQEKPCHWYWENPYPQGNDLNDVWVFDTDNMVAVGEKGTIIRYNGVNWRFMVDDITVGLKDIWADSMDNIFVE